MGRLERGRSGVAPHHRYGGEWSDSGDYLVLVGSQSNIPAAFIKSEGRAAVHGLSISDVCFTSIRSCERYVRFGSKADICNAQADVR